jgi:transcriptional regulator with XRE-family HTH domain
MSEIGGRIKEERIRLKRNQQEFAAFGGVARNAQSNYEKGERVPDAEYLTGISKSGADVNYILTGIRMNTLGSEDLNKEETALLDNFRHLGIEDQKAIYHVSAAMAIGSADKKAENK